MNSPLSNTTSFAFVGISTCCDEDIPINEGYMNPVTVTAPIGTVVNPQTAGTVRTRDCVRRSRNSRGCSSGHFTMCAKTGRSERP
nr:hydantoinase B/oxoprolinase family protein [Bacillus licheniformis]